jgi:nicotinamidase-related amidase
MERSWDRFLSSRDRAIYARSGWGQRMGFGKRPVVLVVDCTFTFCGDRREPLETSMERWPASCGEAAWRAADAIAQVLEIARRRRVPVVYTKGSSGGPGAFAAGRWSDKMRRSGPPDPERLAQGNTIIAPIAPTASDIVIAKGKPSAFFGSPLAGYLVDLQADSVIVCGGVTSGCVRATVIDAFSLNYRVAVVEEGVFDRGEVSHAVNLFDMDEKYADVVSLSDALPYLDGLREGLFDEQMPALRQATAETRQPALAER